MTKSITQAAQNNKQISESLFKQKHVYGFDHRQECSSFCKIHCLPFYEDNPDQLEPLYYSPLFPDY